MSWYLTPPQEIYNAVRLCFRLCRFGWCHFVSLHQMWLFFLSFYYFVMFSFLLAFSSFTMIFSGMTFFFVSYLLCLSFADLHNYQICKKVVHRFLEYFFFYLIVSFLIFWDSNHWHIRPFDIISHVFFLTHWF